MTRFAGKKQSSVDKKVPSTWSDKATDKNNLWFLAIDLEDSRRFAEAADLYISDAIFSWQKGSLVRAALSCACTANCLERLSDLKLASRLHYESALIYEMHAHQIFNKSVRETLWSLERAYHGYMQAKLKDKAEEVLCKHESLAEKMNLFSNFDIPAASIVPITKEPLQHTQTSDINTNTLADSQQLVQHVHYFLKMRSSSMDISENDNAESKKFPSPHVMKGQWYWNQSY